MTGRQPLAVPRTAAAAGVAWVAAERRHRKPGGRTAAVLHSWGHTLPGVPAVTARLQKQNTMLGTSGCAAEPAPAKRQSKPNI